MKTNEIRAKFYIDPYNEKAKEVSQKYEQYRNEENPNIIFVFGGDGCFLHCVHDCNDMELPLLGINCGTVGFLMNNLNDFDAFLTSNKPLKFNHFPLLDITATLTDGSTVQYTAFNDTWIEREEGQCSWFEVSVNGNIYLPKVACDGLVICTPAGSTGYAHSVGLPQVPVETQLIGFIANNANSPIGLRPVFLPITSEITIRNIQPNKRKTRAFYDGVGIGSVTELRIKVSTTKTLDVGFIDDNSIDLYFIEKVFKMVNSN